MGIDHIPDLDSESDRERHGIPYHLRKDPLELIGIRCALDIVLLVRESIYISRDDHKERHGHIDPEREVILELLVSRPREVGHDNEYDAYPLEDIYKVITIRFRRLSEKPLSISKM